MKLRTLVASAFASSLVLGSAHANPVDVTYTVSGSPGAWSYDFSVTDNLTAFSIYYFGVSFSADHITASPTGWGDHGMGSATAEDGMSFYDVWRVTTPYISSISPGQTLGGFDVLDTSVTPLSSLSWFAYGLLLTDPNDFDTSANYTGPGCFTCTSPTGNYNPGFAGTPTVAAVTPGPAALPLFATGLGGLGLLGWRRKRNNTAATAAA
jgi:hypothetical protein